MSLRHSPQIVTSGLVVCFDASDPKSYPGSGTTWFNRTRIGINGTLVNGVAYSSVNRGFLSFDGTNDYADFTASNLSTTNTIEMWARLGSNYTNNILFGWNLFNIRGISGNFGFNTDVNDIYGITGATVTSLGLVDNWKYYVFQMNTANITNNLMYVNNIQQTLAERVDNEEPGNLSFNNGNGRIAGWRNTTTLNMPMSCASVRIYNRALTAEERVQNFEYSRGRFGI